MNSIIVNVQIIINIIIVFAGYEPMFDFSVEEYEVVVFDGVDIKVRVFSTAREAYDAKKVFVKAGWSVQVTIINNIFDNKQSIGVCTTMCMYTITLTWYVVQCSSMHMYVYYYCYSFMYKEIIMKWVIQMSIRWAIIVVCGIVDYIYFIQQCCVVHMHVPIYKCTVYRVCVYVLQYLLYSNGVIQQCPIEDQQYMQYVVHDYLERKSNHENSSYLSCSSCRHLFLLCY